MAAFVKIADRMYEGASTDTKPTGVPNGTICRYTDTREVLITYDGGTTYINADKRLRIVNEAGSFVDIDTEFTNLKALIGEVQASPTENTLLERQKAIETAITNINTLIGEVQASPTENSLLERTKAIETAITAINTLIGAIAASPTENTVLERLKAIETALAALGYEFTINGVNFNGYANIKMLTLDDNAYNDHAFTLNEGGSAYEVPADHVFIAFQALAWTQQIAMVGRIGESDTEDGNITKEVLKLANGTLLPFMTAVIGVFAAGKFVTAESDSGSSNYTLKSGSVLYGVEVDA